MSDKIYLYCDGGCRGSQLENNVGGWGALLIHKENQIELYGGCRNTTNNIQELTSCIEGLKAVKNKTIPVEVVMNSKYVVSGINDWAKNWVKNNWKKSKTKPVKNKELWRELLSIKSQFDNISFVYVQRHNRHPGNERATLLANQAMDAIEKTS